MIISQTDGRKRFVRGLVVVYSGLKVCGSQQRSRWSRSLQPWPRPSRCSAWRENGRRSSSHGAQGRVAAAEALGVNYRTLVNCEQCRRVSRLMRQVLQEFREAGASKAEEPEGGGAEGETDGDAQSLEQRVAALEAENRDLR